MVWGAGLWDFESKVLSFCDHGLALGRAELCSRDVSDLDDQGCQFGDPGFESRVELVAGGRGRGGFVVGGIVGVLLWLLCGTDGDDACGLCGRHGAGAGAYSERVEGDGSGAARVCAEEADKGVELFVHVFLLCLEFCEGSHSDVNLLAPPRAGVEVGGKGAQALPDPLLGRLGHD